MISSNRENRRISSRRIGIYLLTYVLLSVFAVPRLSFAADEGGQYAIKGAGLYSCDQFVREHDKKSSAYFVMGGWLEGYLTAYNRFSKETYDITPWQTTNLLVALLYNHCKKHPEQKLHDSVVALLFSMQAERLKQFSNASEIRAGNKVVLIYQDTMRQVQERLAKLKHYHGTIDGKFNSGTQEALKKFQSRSKLQVTGLPDQATLLKLFGEK